MDKPPLDDIGRDYARIAFSIERHVPGFIDAYLGPEDERTVCDSDDAHSADDIVAQARDLLARIPTLDVPETRKGYLTKQVAAMVTTARRLSGEVIPYREEVRFLFDVEPSATPEAVFEAAIADLERLIPGGSPLSERVASWRQTYVIAPEIALELAHRLLPQLRSRTSEIVDLPEGETVEIRLVEEKPWSGYNWYLGGGRSRVDLNTDLPIYAYRLTDLLAHEGYPGHHTEHTLKERLYTERGYGEHALQLINTPECVISEGIATLAENMLFSSDDLARFRHEQLYPVAGIVGEPEREAAITAALRILRASAGNAALLLHEEERNPEEIVDFLRRYGLASEAEARQRLRFIADPLWRAYIFTYHVGYDLLSAWLEGVSDSERRRRFRGLLTEQIYPSQIAAWTLREGERAPA